MTTEIFTSKAFEKTLGHIGSYISLGVIRGEFCYKIPLDGQSALIIRSSVKENDLSASSSRDRAQEVNITYVADTRTKNKLYYVQGD